MRHFPGIGPNWVDAKGDSGRRRFENPDDFVTIEIAAALARNIRVIPVLVDGARTAKADKLPDSIKPLVRRNAVEVRNTNFGRDDPAPPVAAGGGFASGPWVILAVVCGDGFRELTAWEWAGHLHRRRSGSRGRFRTG